METRLLNRCESCGSRFEAMPEICSACGAFAMIVPESAAAAIPGSAVSAAVDAAQLSTTASRAVPTRIPFWDDLLGGGLVRGSTLVLYGPEGTRKTTWAGCMARGVAAARRGLALYLSAEMPAAMVAQAVRRQDPNLEHLKILGLEHGASNFELCGREAAILRPDAIVYDSLQAFEVPGQMPGSQSAIVSLVLSVRRLAMMQNHCAILISQVNKAGLPSGPRRPIHDCDVVVELAAEQATLKKSRFVPHPRTVVIESRSSEGP